MRTAQGVWREREGLLIRLEDPQGRAGYGEVAPVPGRGPGMIDEAQALLARLGGRVEADRLVDIEEHLDCVRFALACATDRNPDSPAADRCLAVAALLPAGRDGLAAAVRAAAEGFVAFKWKVGVFAVAEELAMLDDLVAGLPCGARLRVDANGVWTSQQAARWLARCAERPIEFVEQPCLADATAGPAQQRQTDDLLCGLARDFPTPIALDESATGLASLRSWCERGWPGVVVVKPALAGAPAEVLALLAKHAVDAVFSSALETVVGRQAALQMAFRYRGPQERALGFGILPLFEDARFDGMARAPFIAADEAAALDLEAAWNALN